ncbi:adenine DNA glycosylase-like [Ptychodera flava]|uniref:adenine DNA glycosylase-like n=1 Tax=Ptychodera flava TaxID=63121 RepID=UPI00396A7A89
MVRRKDQKKKQIKTEDDRKDIKSEESCYHSYADEVEIQCLRSDLLQWYDANKRDLPWRQLAKLADLNKRAYSVWVSEIMLQQTQVATVINYYERWMKKWPTLQDLARANLEEVNEMWSGLGYYSRGRRLHEGAQKVVNEMDGEMPTTAETLLKLLPGVGKYTAGAIASIAFNEVTGVVDGNVIRVLSRARAIGADSTSQHVIDALWSLANKLVDPNRPGDFNQAMMELGATVCTPKTPQCSECPLKSYCRAYAKVEKHKTKSTQKLLRKVKEEKKEIKNEESGETRYSEINIPDIECVTEGCRLCIPPDESWDSSQGVMNFPRKPKKKPPREEKTAVCIIVRQNQNGEAEFLLVQRPDKGLLANLWEFPSVQVNAELSEKKRQIAMDSYLREKLPSIEVSTQRNRSYIGEVVHIFSHIHQTYMVETFTVDFSETTCDNCHDNSDAQRPWKWMTKEDFTSSAISTAVKKIFKAYESLNGLPKKGSTKRKASGPTSGEKDKKKQMGLEAFFKPKPKTV